MELLSGIFTAFGLSASAGLNAYIPLLIVGLIAHYAPNTLSLTKPWDTLANPWIILLLCILVIIEMFRPVGSRADITDRAKLGTGYRCCQAPGDADDGMAACNEPAAQRAADEAGGTGH